jgi:hypothetical protein
MKSKYLEIINSEKEENCYYLKNKKENVLICSIKKIRVGKFMHWCLVIDDRFTIKDDSFIFFTNGCLKEISNFINKLYSEDRKNETKT